MAAAEISDQQQHPEEGQTPDAGSMFNDQWQRLCFDLVL